MRHFRFRSMVAAGVALSLAGCAVTQSDVNDAYDQANATASAALDGAGESVPLVEHVDSAFLGDRPVPLAYVATLPAVFRDKKVTFPPHLGIKTLGTLVSSASGYPVHISPDVYIPRDALIPRASGETKGNASGVGAVANQEPVYEQPCEMCGIGQYMHDVAENLGLDWEFDGSTINVSRFVTRTYQIAAIPGKVSIDSTMSKGTDTSTGNQSTGSTGGTNTDTGSFSAKTSTGRKGDFDQMDIIKSELTALSSPMGKVLVNPQSRLVIVYDTKEAADRMGELLKRENAVSTRQVLLRVRTIQMALNRGSEAGANADVVFNRMQGGLAKWAVSFASPTSLASGGGTVGLSVLQSNALYCQTAFVSRLGRQPWKNWRGSSRCSGGCRVPVRRRVEGVSVSRASRLPYRHQRTVDPGRAVDAPESDGLGTVRIRQPAPRSHQDTRLGRQRILVAAQATRGGSLHLAIGHRDYLSDGRAIALVARRHRSGSYPEAPTPVLRTDRLNARRIWTV
nr:type II secretory pathway protein [Paraburkholderia bannensis]